MSKMSTTTNIITTIIFKYLMILTDICLQMQA